MNQKNTPRHLLSFDPMLGLRCLGMDMGLGLGGMGVGGGDVVWWWQACVVRAEFEIMIKNEDENEDEK